MTARLITISVFLLATFAYGTESIWFQGDFADAKQTAEKEGKLLLMTFLSEH